MGTIQVKFKYLIPNKFIKKIQRMEEFANGATQVTIRTKEGNEYGEVLLSMSQYIVAIRGHMDLPFSIDQIDDVFQKECDKNPKQRGGWYYWDDWEKE